MLAFEGRVPADTIEPGGELVTTVALPPEMEERARSLHDQAFVFDACFSTPGFFKEEAREIQAFLDGGVDGGLATLAAEEQNFVKAVDNINRHLKVFNRHPDKVRMCRSVAELEQCQAEGKVGFVTHFQDTRPIETDLDYLGVFHQLGLRVLQLTYNTQNYVGSGCCELHDAGLSSFGRQVVEECNRLGVLIDLSHCGYDTCRDAIRHSRRPVSLTHVGALAVCPATGRNKPDDILQGVADTGGVIGIAFFAPLVKRNPATHEVLLAGVDDVLDHVDHVVKLVGSDHVGIGSDLSNYYARTLELPAFSSIRSYRPLRPDVFGVGPVDRYDPWPVGLDSHAKMTNLTRGLVKRGYTDADVKKILGGNWLRLFRETWRADYTDR
jgi:membrane dipeptidase